MEHIQFISKLDHNVANSSVFKFSFNVIDFLMLSFEETDNLETLEYNQNALKLTINEFVKTCNIKKYSVKNGVIYHNKKATLYQRGYMTGFITSFFAFGGI